MTTKITNIICSIIAVSLTALLLQSGIMEQPLVDMVDDVKLLSIGAIAILLLKIFNEEIQDFI